MVRVRGCDFPLRNGDHPLVKDMGALFGIPPEELLYYDWSVDHRGEDRGLEHFLENTLPAMIKLREL